MRKFAISVVALLAIAMFAGAAQADAVTDAMAAAQQAYGGNDLKEASTQLQTALAAVNQQLIELLINALPDPPAGWTAEEPEGIDASAVGAGYFATLFVSRDYETPEGSQIELSISANSPMLTSLRMFLSNPMLIAMSDETGMKQVEACGFDAIEHFGDGTFETHVLGGEATLISFQGSRASDEERIRTLVGATDCGTIVNLVE